MSSIERVRVLHTLEHRFHFLCNFSHIFSQKYLNFYKHTRVGGSFCSEGLPPLNIQYPSLYSTYTEIKENKNGKTSSL